MISLLKSNVICKNCWYILLQDSKNYNQSITTSPVRHWASTARCRQAQRAIWLCPLNPLTMLCPWTPLGAMSQELRYRLLILRLPCLTAWPPLHLKFYHYLARCLTQYRSIFAQSHLGPVSSQTYARQVACMKLNACNTVLTQLTQLSSGLMLALLMHLKHVQISFGSTKELNLILQLI